MSDARVHDSESWGAVSDTLAGVFAGSRIALTHAFIVPGSDTLQVDGVRIERDRYTINYHMGTLRMADPIPDGAVVVISYQRMPFLLDPVYRIRDVELSRPTGPDTLPIVRRPSKSRQVIQPTHNLSFGGMKSVSFSVGSNRGATLDQSLRATIEGQLTPSIKVKALLSDNNLPIQPEGNTAELEYFDRVFVEIEGTRGKATLGDFVLSSDLSTFSPIKRQVKGASAAVHSGLGTVALAGATSKGVFRSLEFRGRTGRQGPYDLLSQGRVTAEVVIAGTERVYVDGAPMKRGQNNDYVIDYDRGTITFTPRRLITTDTEIAIDYEVTQELYDRGMILVSVRDVPLGGGFELSTILVRERDSKDRPRGQAFTDEEIEVLVGAGDDRTKAITGGVVQTTVGNGEYILVPADSSGPDRYAFNDTTGNYIVSFVEVGQGTGDYGLGGVSARGRTFYKYVGAGQGRYLVGKALPLPESVQLGMARLRRDGDRFDVDAEWNVSDYDRNLFSELDGNDDTGAAGRLRIGLEDNVGRLGKVGITGMVSVIDEDFKSFDRKRPQFYYRDWNLENVPQKGREVVTEGQTTIEKQNAKLRYAIGRIRRGNFDGLKHEAYVSVGTLDNRGVEVRAFDTEIDGDAETRTRRHGTARAAFGLWNALPSVRVGSERYRESVIARADSGIAYRLVGVRLQNRNPGRFFMSVEVERRDTEDIDTTDTWRDRRRDDTYAAALKLRGAGLVTGEAQVTHRKESDRVTGAEAFADLARIKATINAGNIGFRTDVDYEISQKATRTLERSVVFVGEGKGDYNQQGESVGKGLGDYTLVFVPTDNLVPTRGVEVSLRVVWKPPPGGGVWAWLRDNVGLDATFAVKEETTFDPAWKVYLLVPSALQREDATLFGNTLIRQNWSLLRGVKNTSLTYRYQREDTEDNRFEGVRENRFFGEHALRLSRSLSQLVTTTAEVGRRVRTRGGTGISPATGSAYNIEEFVARVGAGLRFSAGSTVDLDVAVTIRNDETNGVGQNKLSFQPRAVYRLSSTVNVFARYDFSRVGSDEGAAVRPIIFDRDGNAHRWSIAPNIRISKVISIVATYQGRRETTFSGALITEHELRMETRAFF